MNMHTGNAVISEIVTPLRRVSPRVHREVEEWRDRHFNDIGALCRFVGDEIRQSKMKYTKLAELANCHPTTISKLAHDETSSPRAHTVLQVLRALGFEVVVRG